MKRLIVILFATALLACGGSDTAPTEGAGTTGDSPEVSAAASGAPDAPSSPSAPSAPDAPEVPAAAAEAAAAAADPQVASCLELFRQGNLGNALPVCLAALESDPGNAEIQSAVNAARAESADLAAAAAAAQANVDAAAATADAAAAGDEAAAAADAAASQVEGLTGGLGK